MSIDNQFDDEPLQQIPNIRTMYYYYSEYKSNGFTLLMKLVLLTRKNKEAITLMRDLLNENPNIINQKNSVGCTALMMAAASSNTHSTEDTVKILIDAGANVNLQNNKGYTALIYASTNTNTSSTENTVKMLIDAGADVNLQDNNGETALMAASTYSNCSSTNNTVKILINVGTDINIQNNYGKTTLNIAELWRNLTSTKRTVKLLTEAEMFFNNSQYVKG